MVPSPSPKAPKKTHKALDLKAKLNIIERMSKGARVSSLAKELQLPVSTVSTVWCKRDKYEALSKTAVVGERLKVIRTRDSRMEKMECMLCSWIENRTQRRQPLSQALICDKAASLFGSVAQDNVQESQPSTSAASPSASPSPATPSTFKASHGWFYRFKTRTGLHNIRIQGEAAAADTAAVQEFPTVLQKVVEENGCNPRQVFNIDETGLYWKRMPSRTFLYQEERVALGFKAAKDRLSPAFGCNTAGDVKLKPLLVYHSENPRALKGVLKSSVPVVWRSNRKA